MVQGFRMGAMPTDCLWLCVYYIKDEVTMTSTIPAGNVAQGLAWTYYFGFLKLVLPGTCITNVFAKQNDLKIMLNFKMII